MTSNCIELLKAIRAEMTGFKGRNYLASSIHSVMREFYLMTQVKHQSNQEYFDAFNTLSEGIEDAGAQIGIHPSLIESVREEICADFDNPTPDEETTASSIAEQRYLDVAFLRASDKGSYGLLIENIDNFFSKQKRDIQGGHIPGHCDRSIRISGQL